MTLPFWTATTRRVRMAIGVDGETSGAQRLGRDLPAVQRRHLPGDVVRLRDEDALGAVDVLLDPLQLQHVEHVDRGVVVPSQVLCRRACVSHGNSSPRPGLVRSVVRSDSLVGVHSVRQPGCRSVTCASRRPEVHMSADRTAMAVCRRGRDADGDGGLRGGPGVDHRHGDYHDVLGGAGARAGRTAVGFARSGTECDEPQVGDADGSPPASSVADTRERRWTTCPPPTNGSARSILTTLVSRSPSCTGARWSHESASGGRSATTAAHATPAAGPGRWCGRRRRVAAHRPRRRRGAPPRC